MSVKEFHSLRIANNIDIVTTIYREIRKKFICQAFRKTRFVNLVKYETKKSEEEIRYIFLTL